MLRRSSEKKENSFMVRILYLCGLILLGAGCSMPSPGPVGPPSIVDVDDGKSLLDYLPERPPMEGASGLKLALYYGGPAH